MALPDQSDCVDQSPTRDQMKDQQLRRIGDLASHQLDIYVLYVIRDVTAAYNTEAW
jgi:hypothetical protein